MKILRLIFIVLAALACGFVYYRFYYSKPLSPSATANYNKDGLEITVDYCRPSKRDRVIFGNDEQKALVPYGKWWRTGANEATVIKINKDVIIGDKPLKAGRYTIFTIPSPTTWTVMINAEVGQWGLSYNPAKDILKTEVSSSQKENAEEMFLIDFTEQPKGANMILHWDTTEVAIPIKIQE